MPHPSSSFIEKQPAVVLVLLLIVIICVPSCHRSGDFNVPPISPPVVICDLIYSVSQVQLTPLVEMTPLQPIIPPDTPCQPIEYLVEPALPAGLSIDPVTGIISGTPTVSDLSDDYLISSVYAEGVENFSLTIVILPFPPAFSYPQTEVDIAEGDQVILSPTLAEGSGAVDFWSVEAPGAPPLSAIVDSVTGELALLGNGNYIATVTGINEVGEASFAITVTTVDTPQLMSPLLFIDDGDGVLGSGDQIRIETSVPVDAPAAGVDTLAMSSGSSLGSDSVSTSSDGFTLVTLGPGAALHGRGAAAAVGGTTPPPQNQLPSYGSVQGLVTSSGTPFATTSLDLFPGMIHHVISDQPATDIVVFELQGDGIAEALVIIDGQVHLLQQQPMGTWSLELIGADQVVSIDSSDLDRDGDLDAVAVGSAGVSVIWNEEATLTVSSIDTLASTHVKIADIDGNGTHDLLVARSGGNLQILAGDGSGDFVVGDNLAIDGSLGIEVVDIDRDGFLDIATAQPAVMRGGSSGFSAWSDAPLPATTTTGVTSIKIDRADGWSAIVWVSGAGDLHRIDISSGVWSTDVTGGSTRETGSILACDYDRDGGEDLLMATASGFQLRPSLGALPVPGSTIETAPAHLLVLAGAIAGDNVDLDGDGDLDLLAVGDGGIVAGINSLESLLGSIALDEEHDEDAEEAHISALACQDLDQDGWLDLVVTGQSVYYEPGVTWILYGGHSGAAIPSEEDAQMVLEGADIRTAAFIDVDRDGDLDLLLGAKHGIDRLLIQLAPREWQVVDFPGGFASDKTRRFRVADLNNDGIDDVAQACHGMNRIWLGDGEGSFTTSAQPFPPDITYEIDLVDVDRDGDLDLISGNSTGRHNRLWINDGAANFSDSGQVLGVMEVRSIAHGDFDGDGDPDLLLGQNGSGQVGFSDALWLNDGNGTFTAGPTPDPSADTTMQLAVGDLDLDGSLDIAKATATNLKVQWNQGATYSSPLELDNHFHGTVILVDIDGDGDLDLFAGTDEEDVDVWISR